MLPKMTYADIFRLDGRAILIPGGAGGIGSACAVALAEFGADIVIAGRSAERAEAVCARVRETGREALASVVDVTKPEDVDRMVDETVRRFGRLDGVFNCVGTNVEHDAEAYPLEDWDRVYDMNVRSTFTICQAAARVMIPRRQGKIVNISSVRGQLGIRRGYAAYTSSKAAVNLLTKQLASEWAKHNINVNVIAPTFIETPLVAHMLAEPAFRQGLVNRIPLGRVGRPDDIVGAVVYLFAPASDFITGHVLLIDGGVTACQ
jgi:gluconate 5-dehydrogenase